VTSAPSPVQPRRPRLLIAGDAVVPTGFARAVHSAFSRLVGRFEIAQMGVSYSGDPHDWPWPIYRAALYGAPFGEDRIAELAEKLQPDIVVLVSDPTTADAWLRALQDWPGRERALVAAYLPVERSPLPARRMRGIADADLLLAYTGFGAAELRRASERLAGAGERPLPAPVIVPHAVDTGLFYPGDRTEARHRLFGTDALDGAFIVLNANRNQPRKRIDVTIKGFALFAEGKEDAHLFLHMGRVDEGWDVVELATRWGIDDRLLLSSDDAGLPNVPVPVLNLLYNACDVGVNTSSGEGWGLVAFEHAATGAAQIVPGHSGPAELWRGAAELLEPALTLTSPENLEEDWIIRPETVAAALERLYGDRAYLREMSSRALANARRPELRCDAVAQRWEALLLGALEAKRAAPANDNGHPEVPAR
jgi:glycosyltransferase involved in cell wall biosynthesis